MGIQDGEEEGSMKYPDEATCRKAAREYLERSGMEMPYAKNMVKAYIDMGSVGTVTLKVSGPGRKSESVTIDAGMVEQSKIILRGLKLIEATT